MPELLTYPNSDPATCLGFTGGPSMSEAVRVMIAELDVTGMVAKAITTAQSHFTRCAKWSKWAGEWLSGVNRDSAIAFKAECEPGLSHGWEPTPLPAWWAEMAAQYAGAAARQLPLPDPSRWGRCNAAELAARSLACSLHFERGHGLHLTRKQKPDKEPANANKA